MKRLQDSLIALLFAVCCSPALAQTANPATTKPNQNTPPATNTNSATDNNLNANPTASPTPTRTDSVTTVPKEGTSISTAPGTKKEKTGPKASPAKKKTTNP